MRKRLVSICLLISLVVNLCSCSKPEKEVSAEELRQQYLPETLQSLSYDEHLDISIGYWNIEGMENTAENDQLRALIEKMFNISIQPISVTWTNYKERYQILMATDSLPDVFADLTISSNDANDSAAYTQMIETGSICSLPDDMSPYPSLSSLLDSVSYTRYSDGKYYAIPRCSFIDTELSFTDAALLVRRDWMNNLNISDPKSFDDFAYIVTAFAKNDPDGNGIDDTIGYNVNTLSAIGKWVMLGIAPECNVYSWIEQDGRYVPSWSTEQFKEVVKAYSQLYESGGLDPDFYSKSPSTILEDFAAGRLGALEYKSSPGTLLEVKKLWNELNDKPFEECVDFLPIFPAADGVRYSNSSSIFWSESYISSNAGEEKTQRILALFEFLLSDKGYMLTKYGIEGYDYQKTEDGKYECLLNTDDCELKTLLDQKYPSMNMFSGLATWGGSWTDFEANDLNKMLYGEDTLSISRNSALWYASNTQQLNRPYSFLMFPKEASSLFSTSVVQEKFIQCIIRSDDALDSWNNVLAQLNEEGLEEYIDRQNDAYSAFLSDK